MPVKCRALQEVLQFERYLIGQTTRVTVIDITPYLKRREQAEVFSHVCHHALQTGYQPATPPSPNISEILVVLQPDGTHRIDLCGLYAECPALAVTALAFALAELSKQLHTQSS
ncbi:hypothetical protein SAMN05444172_2611 [Burkholderia sp. GAS332]|nr:hypothetical protein SAMN05444172_2611 [Burkholderia sp. GAS332]